jgi:hypothetical protein
MSADGELAYRRLLEEMAEEFPSFRLIPKDQSRFQKLVHRALVVVTLGQMRDYLGSYHTTMGTRIYVTPDWEDKSFAARYVTLCHERIHMRQFRRFTFVGMSLLYLLVPLPMGLAYFRALFEREAYAESIRAAAEMYGLEHVREPDYRSYLLRQFTGPSYGWMWPFPRSFERWYRAQLARVGADAPERGEAATNLQQ